MDKLVVVIDVLPLESGQLGKPQPGKRLNWSAIPNGYDKLWGKYLADTQAGTADDEQLPRSKAFEVED